MQTHTYARTSAHIRTQRRTPASCFKLSCILLLRCSAASNEHSSFFFFFCCFFFLPPWAPFQISAPSLKERRRPNTVWPALWTLRDPLKLRGDRDLYDPAWGWALDTALHEQGKSIRCAWCAHARHCAKVQERVHDRLNNAGKRLSWAVYAFTFYGFLIVSVTSIGVLISPLCHFITSL